MSHAPQAVDTRAFGKRRAGGTTEPFGVASALAAPQAPARAAMYPPVHGARVSRATIVAAVLVVAAAGLLTSTLTYRAGRAWRDRAQTEFARTEQVAVQLADTEAQLAAARGEVRSVRQQLDQTTAQLQRSEADVAQLEARLQALSTEKARVEDEREAVRGERDRLASVAGLAAQIGRELDGCVGVLSSWIARQPSGLDYSAAGSWADWAGSSVDVQRACRSAQTTNARLQSAVNG